MFSYIRGSGEQVTFDSAFCFVSNCPDPKNAQIIRQYLPLILILKGNGMHNGFLQFEESLSSTVYRTLGRSGLVISSGAWNNDFWHRSMGMGEITHVQYLTLMLKLEVTLLTPQTCIRVVAARRC